MMTSFLLVQVSVWMALVAWFVGAWCRTYGTFASDSSRTPLRQGTFEAVYRWSWLWSAVATWVHVIASYALVHAWDHQAVLQQTAEESFQVTGLRAAWGVYVNFGYASILLVYSLVMLWLGRRLKFVDAAIFWFTSFIVFNATIIFKFGLLRIVSSVAFTALFGFMLFCMFNRPK